MKKMNLDVEALVVESFETSDVRGERGTVRGHGYTDTTCAQRVCTCPTVGNGFTCADTCQDSCGGTCWIDTCGNTCDTCGDFCTDTGLSQCNAPLSYCAAC